MIALRADDDVHGRGTANNLFTFSLRDAARNRNHAVGAHAPARFPQLPNASELRIDLFGGLFPDMAGVEDNEIGLNWTIRLGKSMRHERTRHAFGIIDVHLAAKGLDEYLFGYPANFLPYGLGGQLQIVSSDARLFHQW